MNKKIINFTIKKINKSDFYNKDKKIFNIDDIDANKILVSKKEQYVKHNSSKHFIGYKDNGIIRLLYLFTSQTTGYINKFDKNKITVLILCLSWLKIYNFLKNTMKYGKKIEKLMKIDFKN